MSAPRGACLLNRTMKSFSIEKALKTGSNSESRLGTLSLPISSEHSLQNGETTLEVANKSTTDSGGAVVTVSQKCSYRTPMYIIHTQTGSIPHVTPEVLKKIYLTMPGSSATADNSRIPPVQISMDSTLKFADSLGKFEKGIGKFVGLPDVPTFVTVHDSLQPFKSGHNDKFGIALWSKHGRTSLTPELFMKTLNSFKPSLCQILSDYDVRPETSGMKRMKKSASRAEEYTSFVVKEKSAKNSNESETGMFITIEAAWFEINEDEAKKTLANLMEHQHQFEGIVIAGLNDRFAKTEPKSKNDSKKSTREPCKLNICENLNDELVEKIMRTLPSNLPKYIPGPFALPQMIDLISKGADLLDSSVATIMADNAEAMLLDKIESILPSITTSAENVINGHNEQLPERCQKENNGLGDANEAVSDSAVISLKDKRFFDDFRPLSNCCTCYTCRKHTRSYVHHLYATDELLGPVVIQMHNLTVIDRFFKILRGILQDADNAETAQEKLITVKKLMSNSSLATTEASSNETEDDLVIKMNKK